MKERIELSGELQHFFAFSFLVIGILWILAFLRNNHLSRFYYAVGGIGFVYVCIAAAIFFYKIRSKAVINVIVLMVVLNCGYLFMEIFTYFYVGFTKEFCESSYYSKSCLAFDKITGFRYKENSCRFVRLRRGEVIFDQVFRINRQGYISRKDYLFKKPNRDTIRYMVLGDSFTAGGYLQIPWPDRIEEVINSSNSNVSYEFYSFAADGIGLSNWHEIFFKEIIPTYEFDGIIIAIYEDNLYRKFAIAYTDKSNSYFNNFLLRPKNRTDFEVNYIPKMRKICNIINDTELNKRIQNYVKSIFVFAPLDLYLLRKFDIFRISVGRTIKRKGAQRHIIFTDVQKRIGKERLKKLQDIIKWCKRQNKQVVLVSIPAKYAIMQSGKTLHQQEIELIAKDLEVLYYDGYEVFKDLSPRELNSHWLRYDNHWNQQGSDRFARHFSAIFLKYHIANSAKNN